MSADSIPVAPLSIWKPIHLGSDELGQRVAVTLAERNMLVGGGARRRQVLLCGRGGGRRR
jgi:hypothetical protein